jgi:hypothetical protein
MASHFDRKSWILIGFGIFVIVILVVSLIFLIFSEKKLPDNAIIINNDVIKGEELNEETVKKIAELLSKNPGLEKLPLTVEYYADDFSDYIKYILSYKLDDSKRGFVVLMKDYTGEGKEVGFDKLKELGIDVDGLEMVYENLTEDTLNFRADVI